MLHDVLSAIGRVASPPVALGAGIALALSLGNPWPRAAARASRLLLQASIVGLGFGMPVRVVLEAGGSGVVGTAAFIAVALLVGLGLGRWMRLERHTAMLITSGTSICGGSAIAAVGPAIGAPLESMSVSLATVFVLNAVALYVFPPVGHALQLTQHQFGVWAALAIHDTSSVVGAAAAYGAQALQDATILKLARALWILPLALLAPWIAGRFAGNSASQALARPHARVAVPWFIGLFLGAAVVRSLSPVAWTSAYDGIAGLARFALVVTLFLIGSQLTRAQLRAVGVRPLVHGVVLWILVATASLGLVYWGVA